MLNTTISRTNLLLLLVVAVGLSLTACGGGGRINNDESKHAKFINDSKMNNSAVISLDTLYFKGEPYAIYNQKGFSIASFYEFYAITGEKAIEVLPYSSGEGSATSNHEYRFFGTCTGMSAYVDFNFSAIKVCENVINNNLMSTTGLRPIDVGNFCKAHPRPAKFNPGLLKVKREMTKEIKISQGSGEIFQGNVLIGKFTQGSAKSADLKKSNAVYKVNFTNNQLCATIRFGEFKVDRQADPNMEVLTEFDGLISRMNIDAANQTFDIDAFKQAIQFLVQKGYL
ncbi:MAG: hypothetical protein WCR42_03760 [bacterium]